MANSKYEYVKQYELGDQLLPSTYLVIRIDGQSFHRFTAVHHYYKPNDCRGLQLMNYAAAQVMRQYPEVFLGIGASDEMSLVLPPSSQLYNRRSSKINSSLCSLFTAAYTFHWPRFFPDTPLQYPPSFDSRVVCLPTDQSLRDYLSWRQVDFHINNLYNTCYAHLIGEYTAIDKQSASSKALTNGAAQQKLHTPREAEEILRVTNSAGKNELLFTQYGVNYNTEPAVARKGSVLIWKHHCQPTADATTHKHVESPAALPADVSDILVVHDDLIGDDFWQQHVGLIPHVSKSEQKKQMKKLATKAKKAHHAHRAQPDHRPDDNAQTADR